MQDLLSGPPPGLDRPGAPGYTGNIQLPVYQTGGIYHGKRTLPLLTLLLLLSLLGCGRDQKVTSFSIANPAKVTIQTGPDVTEFTAPDTVALLTEQITSLQFQKQGEVDSTGWTYWLKWYDSQGNMLFDATVSTDQITHDGYVWRCVGGTIDTGEYDRLLGGA